MASNDLIGLLAMDPSGLGGRSILDQSLREVLLRAMAGTSPWYRHGMMPPWHGMNEPFFPTLNSLLEPTRTDPLGADLFLTLERERSDVASVARFGHRIECASYHLYVAFDKAHVEDFELSVAHNTVKPTHKVSIWYCSLVNSTFNRYRDLRRALLHEWTPPAEVEILTFNAFRMLSEITPAESQLRNLFVQDRSRAFQELARHLDIVAEQLKAAIQLATDLETIVSEDSTAEEQVRLNAVQAEILGKAGRLLSLTTAAKELGVSRQALHKRIRLGTALGLMHGSELVVPETQFVSKEGKLIVVEGLSAIITLFDKSGAGRWSAFQFLTDTDPCLRKVPLEELKSGDRDSVVRAARAYLGLDEG